MIATYIRVRAALPNFVEHYIRTVPKAVSVLLGDPVQKEESDGLERV